MCMLQKALHVMGIMAIRDSILPYLCIYRTGGQCVGPYMLNLL